MQVSTAGTAQKVETLARVRQDPRRVPWGQPSQNAIPFQWFSTSFSAQAHPDNFYQQKQTPTFPVTIRHRTDSQLVVYFRKGDILSDLGFLWGNY